MQNYHYLQMTWSCAMKIQSYPQISIRTSKNTNRLSKCKTSLPVAVTLVCVSKSLLRKTRHESQWSRESPEKRCPRLLWRSANSSKVHERVSGEMGFWVGWVVRWVPLVSPDERYNVFSIKILDELVLLVYVCLRSSCSFDSVEKYQQRMRGFSETVPQMVTWNCHWKRMSLIYKLKAPSNAEDWVCSEGVPTRPQDLWEVGRQPGSLPHSISKMGSGAAC